MAKIGLPSPVSVEHPRILKFMGALVLRASREQEPLCANEDMHNLMNPTTTAIAARDRQTHADLRESTKLTLTVASNGMFFFEGFQLPIGQNTTGPLWEPRKGHCCRDLVAMPLEQTCFMPSACWGLVYLVIPGYSWLPNKKEQLLGHKNP